MNKLVIFGDGDIADIAAYYFERDGIAEVVAHTVDSSYLDKATTTAGHPVVAFESVAGVFPPAGHQMFVALSYNRMNQVRKEKVAAAKASGYSIASYVSPDCTYRSQFPPGENAFIFEDNTIQPFVRIGDNVTMWSGNHIGHHSTIESNTFISSHVVVSGHCIVSSGSFLGVNSTIAHGVTIAASTLVGAGAVIARDTEENGVYVPPRSTKLERSSLEIDL